jgi:hypothetical protein
VTTSRLPTPVEIARYESNGHSIFGASKSHQYLNCKGSIFAQLGRQDSAGYDAAEGTVAHAIAEFWGSWGLERNDLDDEVGKIRKQTAGGTIHEVTITAKMLNYLALYVGWCREAEGEQLWEQRVDFSRLTPIPRQGGTADHVAMRPGHLTITDLKYGVGVQVFAELNTQAMLYALGVIYAWDWLYGFDTVTVRICQPRLDHFDVWETTTADLLIWADDAKHEMAEAWAINAPRTPGEKQCRFCAAKATCSAYVSVIDRLADESFDDMTISAEEMAGAPAKLDSPVMFPEVTSLTTTDIAKALVWRKPVEEFFQAAYEELSSRVFTGAAEVPPGWMVANGRASRSITDEAAAVRRLADLGYKSAALYKREFRSAAALEEMLVEDGFSKAKATAFLKPVVRVTPGRPTLALAKPGREPALDLADESFEDESI